MLKKISKIVYSLNKKIFTILITHSIYYDCGGIINNGAYSFILSICTTSQTTTFYPHSDPINSTLIIPKYNNFLFNGIN